MRGWLIRWILGVVGIMLTAKMIEGFNVTVTGAIFGSIILGVINAVIRPFILVLTLPINALTLGLFTLVINGFMLWLTSAVVKGFDVQGFGPAVIAALAISIISFVLNFFIKD